MEAVKIDQVEEELEDIEKVKPQQHLTQQVLLMQVLDYHYLQEVIQLQ